MRESVAARVLRVCADPNNLPFSNQRQEGFENAIAAIIARELHAKVEYTWWAQRRGFARNTLNAAHCDLIPGVPTSYDLALTTRPYYRSSYVFVTRKDRALRLTSFDDPRLRTVKVGVQLIGDDFANTPPAHALASRNIINNVRGFPVYGNYGGPDPGSEIISAVASGAIDVAVVWGPLAGYYAHRAEPALELTPVSPQIDLPFLPFVFDISMAVRRADTTLRNEIDDAIRVRQAELDQVLDRFSVPRLPAAASVVALGK
jgi:mxaJ protein